MDVQSGFTLGATTQTLKINTTSSTQPLTASFMEIKSIGNKLIIRAFIMDIMDTGCVLCRSRSVITFEV